MATKQKGQTTRPPLAPQTDYTPEFRAHVVSLWLLHRNASYVADMAGCDNRTVKRWVDEYEQDANKAQELHAAYNDRLQEHELLNMQMVRRRALQQVYDRLPEASAAQAATIYGILFDKEQILRGNAQAAQTNVFIDTSGMSDVDKADLLSKALKRTMTSEPLDVEATEVEEK